MKRTEVKTLWEKEKPNGKIRVRRATFVHNGFHTFQYQVVVTKKNKPSKMLWSSSWIKKSELLHNLHKAIQKANGTSFEHGPHK